jgi:mono/diheme cytochrome c family protein
MRILVSTGLVAALTVLAACGSAPTSRSTAAGPVPEFTPEQIEQGRQLFNTGVCARCHGANGEGGFSGPNLQGKAWAQTGGTYRNIVSVIKDGVQLSDIRDPAFRRPMPPRGGDMRLTDEQVNAIAAYIYSLSHPPKAG